MSEKRLWNDTAYPTEEFSEMQLAKRAERDFVNQVHRPKHDNYGGDDQNGEQSHVDRVSTEAIIFCIHHHLHLGQVAERYVALPSLIFWKSLKNSSETA